jgi:ABC-type lipoprotein release transport system permease subunit
LSGPPSSLNDLQDRPLRVALAVLLLALTATGFLLHAALVRGARAEAFRVAILVGEGHIGILPAPGGPDSPALIDDAGPLYTQPELMRSGAQVVPRVTLPVAIGEADELAVLHGVEPGDPQVAMLQEGHVTGKWPSDGSGVAMGVGLAQSLRLKVGEAVDLALDKPDAEPVTVRVVALVHTGREEWDAHGLWSGLTLARVVRGLRNAKDSEAVTHLAVFLPDPATSGEWRERILRMTLPDFAEVRDWWQLDLEPLRYAPQADPGLPWATAMLGMLVMGLLANLLLGPAPLPYVERGSVPPERELR